VTAFDTIYVLVGDRSRRMYSYAWRLWWGRTSFYVKPKYTPLGALKISLDGPDVAVASQPGFKVDLDRSALPRVCKRPAG
jgi:hypothetical protein